MPTTLEHPRHIAETKQLDPARFQIQHDIPLFDEHEAEEPVVSDEGKPETDESGQVRKRIVRYNKPILEAMCRNMNARIRDTGDYTAICITHTPTPREKLHGVPQPEVVGFAGPFYVNKIGMSNPRWCIFARDWAIFNDEADRVRKYPRRSVEVWRRENPADRYFDPIALLGGETPARDLGLNYYARGALGNYFTLDGTMPLDHLVARYSMACVTPAYASGSNTFLPGDGGKRRHADPEPQEPKMLSEDEVNQIVEAVSQLAPFKWAEQQMQADGAKAPPTDDGSGGMPPDAGAPPPDAGAAPPDDQERNAAVEEGGSILKGMGDRSTEEGGSIIGKGASEPPKMGAKLWSPVNPGAKRDPNWQQPAYHSEGSEMNGTPKDRLAAGETVDPERQAAEERAIAAQSNGHAAQLAAENAELKTRLSALEAQSSKKDRYSQVERWAHERLHIDVPLEMQIADHATDNEWLAHADAVERYSQRNPVMLAELTVADAVRADNGHDLNARVRQKISHYAQRGQKTTYEAVVAEVKKEMGIG